MAARAAGAGAGAGPGAGGAGAARRPRRGTWRRNRPSRSRARAAAAPPRRPRVVPLAGGARARLLPPTPTSDQVAYCRGRPVDVVVRLGVAATATVILSNVWTPGACVTVVGWYFVPYWQARFKREALPSAERYPYAGLWLTRVLSVRESLGEAEVVFGDPGLASVTVIMPTGANPRAARPPVPLPLPGDECVAVVVSDEPSLSRFKALPECYVPADGAFVSDGFPATDRREVQVAAQQVLEAEARRGSGRSGGTAGP